jgi:K+-transporting ATPase ATPase A chain
MASLNANSEFYNITTAAAMLVGRFVLAALALAVAGLFARQAPQPPSMGTMPTASWTFAGMLTGVIVIVGALSYLVALSVGPIAEHLQGS